MSERKNILLRLDPAVHDALSRWASDELRSTTAQIEFLLRQALNQAGRLPGNVGGMPRRGRPPKSADPNPDEQTQEQTHGNPHEQMQGQPDEAAETDDRSPAQGAET